MNKILIMNAATPAHHGSGVRVGASAASAARGRLAEQKAEWVAVRLPTQGLEGLLNLFMQNSHGAVVVNGEVALGQFQVRWHLRLDGLAALLHATCARST